MTKYSDDMLASRALQGGSAERFKTTWTSSSERVALEDLEDETEKESDPMEQAQREPFVVIEVSASGVIFWEKTRSGLQPSRPMRPAGWRNAVPGQRLPVQVIDQFSYRLLPIE